MCCGLSSDRGPVLLHLEYDEFEKREDSQQRVRCKYRHHADSHRTDVLPTPLTSVAVERCFSILKHTWSPHRTRIQPKIGEAMLRARHLPRPRLAVRFEKRAQTRLAS